MQEYLVAHRVTGKKGLICRVLYEVILISYIVGTPQRGIVRPVDHHDRRELSRVSYQGEVLPPDYGYECAGSVTLARLIDDYHVEAWHGLPQLMCRDAGSCDDGKDTQKLLKVIRIREIMIEGCHALLIGVRREHDLPQLIDTRLTQALDTAHR